MYSKGQSNGRQFSKTCYTYVKKEMYAAFSAMLIFQLLVTPCITLILTKIAFLYCLEISKIIKKDLSAFKKN